ncbi:MAG: hypothetical protein ACR2QM_08555 [Longimicrobiales bacterium]
MDRRLKRVGLALIGSAALGALAALVIQDQIRRHRRDLFSPNAFRRLAALGHMGREPASIDGVTLLRDFATWEPRRMLKARATAILTRMEQELQRGNATEERHS